MKNERIKVISSPESTFLEDCKEVAAANALCSCKDVCVGAPTRDEE